MAKQVEKETKKKAVSTKKAPAKGGGKAQNKASKTKKTAKTVEVSAPRLLKKYQSEIIQNLKKQFSYKSIMQVPHLDKIVINMGVGAAVQDPKVLDEALSNLTIISGQKPSVRTAKKSISNFKLREGMKIGAKVTLRKQKMYEFLDRLISIALPRVRDFRGISDKSFDGRGNFTLGIKEQIIFPEINIDKVSKVLGMDITFVTTAESDKEAYELLLAFGFPFVKKELN